MKALFLVNARSGTARRVDMPALIRSCCDWADFDITACERKEDLDDIVARAEERGCEAIFAVGGDGTVHEIAKRMVGRKIALGIIPTGSGNGFARHLRIPTKVKAAVATGRDAQSVAIDTAEVNGLPYIGVMGVGFDALIAHLFAGHGRRGLRTYFRAGFSAILGYRPDEYEVEVDGERIARRAFAIVVANGSQWGNNARVAANASMRDGLLDVVIFHDVPVVVAPVMVARVFSGTVHRSRGATTRRGREIVIRRSSAGHAHVDGEPIELPAEVRVIVRPRSLNVLIACDPERI